MKFTSIAFILNIFFTLLSCLCVSHLAEVKCDFPFKSLVSVCYYPTLGSDFGVDYLPADIYLMRVFTFVGIYMKNPPLSPNMLSLREKLATTL